MKNKLLVCAFALAALLTACRQHTDLTGIDSQIAQNTMLGYYAYIGIDSTNVATTLYEWNLANAGKGRVGYYRVASTGNGLDGDVTDSLVWDPATMAPDGLSMSVPVSLRKGGNKTLIWGDGVVHVDGYTTTSELISKATVLRSVSESFANFDFVHNDTTYYITSVMDTTYYLAWKTEVVYFSQDSIDIYKDYLILMADTLAWFNATYPDRAVPDTVRFAKNPQTSGQYKDLYKGLIPRAYEAQDIKEIKTNHGPLHIINSEMIFNRSAALANTGSYYFHEQIWSEECYTKPADTTAIHTDYESYVSDAKWTFSDFTNIKKFNVLFKGHWVMTLDEEIAGVAQPQDKMDKTDYFFEVPLAGFNKADGEVLSNDLKYKTK